jgi:hypothetical protein
LWGGFSRTPWEGQGWNYAVAKSYESLNMYM